MPPLARAMPPLEANEVIQDDGAGLRGVQLQRRPRGGGRSKKKKERRHANAARILGERLALGGEGLEPLAPAEPTLTINPTQTRDPGDTLPVGDHTNLNPTQDRWSRADTHDRRSELPPLLASDRITSSAGAEEGGEETEGRLLRRGDADRAGRLLICQRGRAAPVSACRHRSDAHTAANLR